MAAPAGDEGRPPRPPHPPGKSGAEPHPDRRHVRDACRASYDRVADAYVRRIAGELEGKPFDRELLDRFAADMRGRGPVCDLGCGPGHVARYLKDRGVDVFGLDLSPELVDRARARNPDIPFQVGDMTALDAPDGAWAGIVAFYSILHVPDDEMAATLKGFHRVLEPGGLLLIAFHLGDETVHLDEWWGHPVDVDFRVFRSVAMATDLARAGFLVDETVERDPYPEVEHPSRRAYIRAHRP